MPATSLASTVWTHVEAPGIFRGGPGAVNRVLTDLNLCYVHHVHLHNTSCHGLWRLGLDQIILKRIIIKKSTKNTYVENMKESPLVSVALPR